jgi:hypothetical protein
MRGFGVTGVDFAIEVQMDKLAHRIDMDPMEFRILNAYRDGDMKAHRRTAKNCALIECVQVAAEKAKWPIRDEFRRMSSRAGGGDARSASPPMPASDRSPSPLRPGRTSYERPGVSRLAVSPQMVPSPIDDMPAPPSAPPAPPPTPAKTQHGVTRFSSVFGTRRR